MKTFLGECAGSKITPYLWNAKKSAWVISPWISKDYAEKLSCLSKTGMEVRIITSNDPFNKESIGIFEASKNENLNFLILDKSNENSTFIHSKMYIIDGSYGVSGSANLTYRGLNTNVESLNIIETPDEAKNLEHDFMRVWIKYENKSIKENAATSTTCFSIKNALPLSITFEKLQATSCGSSQLVFYPYYFFEFSFHTSVGRQLFQDDCYIIVNASTCQVVNNDLLTKEVTSDSTQNFVINTQNKYTLNILQEKLGNLHEAKEIAINHFINKNTQHYIGYATSAYGSRTYDRTFVPYKSTISTLKSGFVNLPFWFVQREASDRCKYEDVWFGHSGKLYYTLMYCPLCQTKFWVKHAITCSNCGKAFCSNCVREEGILFRKSLCKNCGNS